MKNVCGEGYKNVLRDNERKDFMEQFMLRKPKKVKKMHNSDNCYSKIGEQSVIINQLISSTK